MKPKMTVRLGGWPIVMKRLSFASAMTDLSFWRAAAGLTLPAAAEAARTRASSVVANAGTIKPCDVLPATPKTTVPGAKLRDPQ
jgi:hypothetical protein